jgi:hypothetical protein
MVEFLTAEQVLHATQRCWQTGYREMDAYTPYPVEGLALALGLKHSRIPSVVFVGGLVGAIVGFVMQLYSMSIDYPLNVGGRPYNSWPVFIPITFEAMVLVASFSALLGMLFLNGLPRPHHPVFNVPGFERASQDRFFLCIEAVDPKFDFDETTRFLLSLSPHGKVLEVPHEEIGPPEEIASPGLQGTVPESRTVVQVGEQQT